MCYILLYKLKKLLRNNDFSIIYIGKLIQTKTKKNIKTIFLVSLLINFQ